MHLLYGFSAALFAVLLLLLGRRALHCCKTRRVVEVEEPEQYPTSTSTALEAVQTVPDSAGTASTPSGVAGAPASAELPAQAPLPASAAPAKE